MRGHEVSRGEIEDRVRWSPWRQQLKGHVERNQQLELHCFNWPPRAMAATKCQINFVCHCCSFIAVVHLLILKQSTHLLVHLPDSSSTRLLLRFHSSSWHNPLVWVSTAAHQYHLPGEKSRHHNCAVELWLAKNLPMVRTGLESHTTTATWRLCLVPFSRQDGFGRSLMSHLAVIVFFLMQNRCKVALLLSLHTLIQLNAHSAFNMSTFMYEKKHVYVWHSRGPCLWISLNLYSLLVIHKEKKWKEIHGIESHVWIHHH